MAAKMFSIKEAAKELDCDQQYVRKLIKAGRLESQLVPIKAGSNVVKHQISADSVKHYKETAKVHTNRPDGRNKWIVYMNETEAARIAKICAESGIPVPFMPNKGEYERRKAAKA